MNFLDKYRYVPFSFSPLLDMEKNCEKQNGCLPNTVIVKTRHPFNKEKQHL